MDWQFGVEGRAPSCVAVNSGGLKICCVEVFPTSRVMNQDEPTKSNEFNDESEEPMQAEAEVQSAPEKPSPNSSVNPLGIFGEGGVKWLARTAIQAATVVAVVGLLLFMLGRAQRAQWFSRFGAANSQDASGSDSAVAESKRYICPMMCTPPSNQPGRCPVCAMELVEATNDRDGDGISVTIEPSARRLVGIQTAVSKIGEVNRTIRTVGSIDFDESRLSTISAYVDGRIEKMYANYVGITVSEGDDVALVYSPQLYTAQTEFITAINNRNGTGRFQSPGAGLYEMARENLVELGMSEDQIDELAISGKPMSRIRIKSPQAGTVIEKSAVDGDYVTTGQQLYRVADLSSVWLMLDLFPDDASVVRFGHQVEAEIQSWPGEVFAGRVAFIDPTVNPKTRTVSVRVEILNVDGKLRPGDYATVRVNVPAIPTEQIYDAALANKYISPMHPQVIRNQPGNCPVCDMLLVPTSELGFASEPLPVQQVVTVPRNAVLLAGEHGVVYVETQPGRFEIRRVTVGPMNRDVAVIVEGLSEGEIVATNGNFLIDSQMQLAGNPSLLDPSKAPSYPSGPLQLPEATPVVLKGESGEVLDQTYDAYFEIQSALAADQTTPSLALHSLIEGLRKLEKDKSVPGDAQRQFAVARRAAPRLDRPIEVARSAFRFVSHSMLRAANVARGPRTSMHLSHYFCPMVPGRGGDWMQPGDDLKNPYWGSEMLACGRVVRDMSGGVKNASQENGSLGVGASLQESTKGADQ